MTPMGDTRVCGVSPMGVQSRVIVLFSLTIMIMINDLILNDYDYDYEYFKI